MNYRLANDIKVTQEHIESATRTNSRACMIMRAMKDRNPWMQRVEVGPQWISFTDPRRMKRYHCITPQSAFEYFLNWDAGFKIEPFTVRLRVMRVTEPKQNSQIATSPATKAKSKAKAASKAKAKRQTRTSVKSHARQHVIHSDRLPGREPRTYRRREWGARVFLAAKERVVDQAARTGTNG